MLPSTYSVDPKLTSLGNTDEYANRSTDSLLYQNLLSSDSVSAQEFIATEGGTRDVMLFIPPNNVSFSKEVHCSEPIAQHHGLSLSLGTHQPSLVHLHPDSNHYSNSGLCSLINQDMQLGIQHLSENDDMKNVRYLPFNSAKTCVDGIENMVGSNETNFMPVINDVLGYTDMFCNSKYINAAQDLLLELVSVHQNSMRLRGKPNQDGSSHMDQNRDRTSDEPPESINNLNELQDKLAKLSSMLGEVDTRYKLYRNHLQLLVSSFDIVAGRGAAYPYTTLTLKTISRQFRGLHDAIKKQIHANEKRMVKHDDNALSSSATLSRLRHVDEQLRNQKAIQHFGGIMRRPWRPQRGLPETAISILRAWLFEHFLHPYPTDSEKLVLATRAGLSRNQVANWFINARVRLWKPMIEDIYREEFGDEDGNQPKSPPDNTNEEMEGSVDAMNKRLKKSSSVSLDLGLQNNEKDSTKAKLTEEVNHSWSGFGQHDDADGIEYGKMKLGRHFDQ